MNLRAYLRSRQIEIDRTLDRYLPKANSKPATLHKAMRDSLFAGGKRLRPILCLAAAEACHGSIRNTLPLACALECIHAADRNAAHAATFLTPPLAAQGAFWRPHVLASARTVPTDAEIV